MDEEMVDVKIEEINSVKKKLCFDIPWPDVKNELDKVYRDVGKKAKIKGFRPGKVPRPVLQTHYKEHAEGEAVQNLVNRFYREALEKNNLTPVSQPEIEPQGIENEKNLAFTAIVEIEPTVDPQNYLGLQLEKTETITTDQDIDARLLQTREMYSTLEDVTEDRVLREKDFATIDFAGTLDGQALDELKSENYFLEIGSRAFIPGFEDQLLGMKSGETKEISVKFPDDYTQENLAGKDVQFLVSLKGIREKKIPELNEEFIKNFEQYETLDALKEDIRKTLENDQQGRDEASFQEGIVDALLKENAFEVPSSLVQRQTFYLMADTQRRMTWAGMDKKQATELSFSMHEKFREEAEKVVKTMFLIKAIAEKEGLSVTDEEVETHIQVIAPKYGQDASGFREKLEKEGSLEQVRMDLLHKKVFSLLEEKATVSIVKNENVALEEGV